MRKTVVYFYCDNCVPAEHSEVYARITPPEFYACDVCGKETDVGYLEEIVLPDDDYGCDGGHIYLIECNSDRRWVKIGIARNLKPRLKSLGVGCIVPYEINLLHSYKLTNYRLEEKRLHMKYADKRGDGEWFDLSDEDIENIIMESKSHPRGLSTQ